MKRWMHKMAFIAGSISLCGCGFSPMLTSVHHEHAIKVRVRGHEGYVNHALTKELEHRLAQLPLTGPISLTIDMAKVLYDTSYGRDATALRTQHVFTARYILTARGEVLKQGSVDATTSYNLDQNDAFSTLTSRMGSDDQLIHALADELTRAVNLAMLEKNTSA